MKIIKQRMIINPVSRTALRMSKHRKRAELSATVHYGAIWVHTDGLSDRQISRLAGALLAAGIPVRGYWDDCDYSKIDPRISGQVPDKPKYVKINATASGRLGGTARAAKLSAAQLKAAGRKANKARWDKYYANHPERVRPKPKRKRRAA